jgi:tetratricopeptide (TPR) repeat protein
MSEARSHTASEVAKLLGLSLAEVRRCARAGFLTPQIDGTGEPRFQFQDLVVLRKAAQMMSGRIRPHRVRAALRKLRDQLPVGQPISGVDVSADGAQIVAREGTNVWDPFSGQMQLNFQERRALRAVTVARPAVDPKAAARSYEEGCVLEEEGRDGAEAAYRRAVELDPDHADARVNLGRLLHEKGKPAEAEPHYRAVLKCGPHAVASFNLAVVLEDLGKEDDALLAYQQAIAADSDCEDAYFNLSRLYERRGERASALRALRTYRNLTRGT